MSRHACQCGHVIQALPVVTKLAAVDYPCYGSGLMDAWETQVWYVCVRRKNM